ncbi:MAG: response regulator transcription factor [Flavobacteriales bacterium]|nr:response regulator transcription factor [Flavobacteriales bacterium]
MTAYIVEDEAPAAQGLVRLLEEADAGLRVVGMADNVEDAAEGIAALRPDLIFMDIHLGDDLCFTIFDRTAVEAPVIFTTAYDKYAIQAFQANGIDYLLKPIELDAVKQALDKVALLKRRFGIDPGVLRELSAMRKPAFRERFMVASGGQIRSVPVDQVAFFQSEGRYVKLVSTDNRRYIVDGTMDKIASELDPRTFFRINRQLIVSFPAIKSMVPYSKSRVKVLLEPQPEEESIVSVERSAEFKAWLDR